jgi:hypothetical protein
MLAKLFTRHAGAERVGGGVYWSHRDAGFVSVPREGGELPGQPADSFTHVPILAVLVIGPILGTAFAFFLPAAAIVGLLRLILGGFLHLVRRVLARRGRRARRVGASLDTAADPQL